LHDLKDANATHGIGMAIHELSGAIKDLEASTEIVLERCVTDANMMQVLAAPYLRQTALCISGWLMLLSLAAANSSATPEDFRLAKTKSCTFFFGQILPEAAFMGAQLRNCTDPELL
jgi:acyl-CoA dehydrogenase